MWEVYFVWETGWINRGWHNWSGFLLMRVGELKASGGVRFVRVWVGVIDGGCELTCIIMSLLLWPCGLLGVR